VDLPGHGDSDVPADEERLGVRSFAADAAALCDALGLDGSVVVGHSAGAAVAVELAVRRPELVAAVIALDGALGFPAELLAPTWSWPTWTVWPSSFLG
jgi:pimeloyl-ACP methyl ester carboxylesterase